MDKQTQKFFTDIYGALVQHINFGNIKVILFGRYAISSVELEDDLAHSFLVLQR